MLWNMSVYAVVVMGATALLTFVTEMDYAVMVHMALGLRLVVSTGQWCVVILRGPSWTLSGMRRKLRYELDWWFSTDATAKVTALLVFAVGVVLAGSAVLVLSNEFDWDDALWLSAYWLADPGAMFDEPPSRRPIALTVTLGGLLLSALIVSVIGDNISARLDEFRSGAVPVVESGHSVVLGWSPKTLTVIRELAEAHRSQRHRHVICVLAGIPKEAMVDAVCHALGAAYAHVSVVCRSGNVSLMSDLSKVSIHTAKSVVLLNTHDRGVNDAVRAQEHETVCIALRIKQWVDTERQRDPDLVGPNVVVEVTDRNVAGCIDMLEVDRCITMFTPDFTGQMMVNFATSPGLHNVMMELTSFSGVEVYIVSDHGMGGRTFGETLLACVGGTVIGLRHHRMHGETAVTLNPPDATELGPHDDLVVIAVDRTSCAFQPNRITKTEHDRTLLSPRRQLHKRHTTRRHDYAFVNWHTLHRCMIRQMDDMVAPGSTLTLFSADPVNLQAEQDTWSLETTPPLRHLHLRFVVGCPTDPNDLVQLALLGSFYTVFVFARREVGHDDGDTAIMPTAVLLAEMFSIPASIPGQIVSCTHHASMQDTSAHHNATHGDGDHDKGDHVDRQVSTGRLRGSFSSVLSPSPPPFPDNPTRPSVLHTPGSHGSLTPLHLRQWASDASVGATDTSSTHPVQPPHLEDMSNDDNANHRFMVATESRIMTSPRQSGASAHSDVQATYKKSGLRHRFMPRHSSVSTSSRSSRVSAFTALRRSTGGGASSKGSPSLTAPSDDAPIHTNPPHGNRTSTSRSSATQHRLSVPLPPPSTRRRSLVRASQDGPTSTLSEHDEMPSVKYIMCELNHAHHKALFRSIDPRIVPVCVDEIAGSAIAQVALQPTMKPIFHELLVADGCELYIHSAERILGDAVDTELTWRDVMMCARIVQVVAIGFMRPNGDFVLNPSDQTKARLWTEDRLVVLSQ
eukprot:m.153640 g.153640  ORF g.153640 m.153640 type:complete len:965 (-) comp11712_c0_seq13:1643-4537(-)